jgi:hypothetical protein
VNFYKSLQSFHLMKLTPGRITSLESLCLDCEHSVNAVIQFPSLTNHSRAVYDATRLGTRLKDLTGQEEPLQQRFDAKNPLNRYLLQNAIHGAELTAIALHLQRNGRVNVQCPEQLTKELYTAHARALIRKPVFRLPDWAHVKDLEGTYLAHSYFALQLATKGYFCICEEMLDYALKVYPSPFPLV